MFAFRFVLTFTGSVYLPRHTPGVSEAEFILHTSYMMFWPLTGFQDKLMLLEEVEVTRSEVGAETVTVGVALTIVLYPE